MAQRGQPLKMGLKQITGLADAVDDNDAVNKGQMDATIAATTPADIGAAGDTAQTDFISGLVELPDDKDYLLVVKSPIAMTITETVTKSVSGTCTATFKINTTALGGTANSVSSTEESQTHSSSNSLAAADDLVLTVSSNSSCDGLSFTIKFTRDFAN